MVKISAFFKLIRWPNLLIIALVQYLIRFFIIEFAFIENFSVPHVLNHFQYFLGVLCSVSLAGAGYVVNDLNDLQVDKHNKPSRVVIHKNISASQAWTIYGILNIIAVASGYWVAQAAGFQNLWLIPVLAIALLYLYAVDLKKRAVLGNLVVSLLVGLPIFFAGVFDILPAANAKTAEVIKPVWQVIMAYSAFAVFTNFIREIIKDAEDLEGDKAQGYRTLAVLLGRDHVRYVILTLLFVLLVFTGAYNLYLFESDIYSSLYILIFVNLPILYLTWKILIAKTKLDFRKASILMKIIMLTGIVSMVIFTLSVKAQF